MIASKRCPVETLIFLAYLGGILLLGILASILAKKIHVPHVLLLVILGVGLNYVRIGGEKIIAFPMTFLSAIGTLALIMILFDSTSKFRLKRFDDYSIGALKVTFLFLILSIPVFAMATYLLFKTPFGLTLVFAALMVGTAPDITLTMFEGKKSRVLEFLKVESILNTPLTVLVPFIILDVVQNTVLVGGDVWASLMKHVPAFLLQLVVGIGAGVLVALIMFKAMRNQYSEKLSPLAIVVAAILAYVLAEWLQGNGIIAVTALGLFFGNVTLKEKENLTVFSSLIKSGLEILVFILIGLMIDVPLDAVFLAKAFGLYLVLLAMRFIVMVIGLHGTPLFDATFKERIFMTLNSPKGIAVAVVVFILSTLPIAGMDLILDLIFTMLVLSILVSSITVSFCSFFCEDLGRKMARTGKRAVGR